MWALRRSCNPRSLRLRVLVIGTSHACCAKSEVLAGRLQYEATISSDSYQAAPVKHLFFHALNIDSEYYMGRRGLSSQAGAESSESDDGLEDGFSELDTPDSDAVAERNVVDGNEDELISEPELSEDDNGGGEDSSQNALELVDTETESVKRRLHRRNYSELFNAIIADMEAPVHSVLNKWVEEENDLTREDLQLAMLTLRKRKMFGKALQLSEWMEASERFDFVDRDYASRLDLIAKIRGHYKAEKYLERIPESMRGEVAYRTLLANYVADNNVTKSEALFNKMKDMKLPITTFTCNQLLLLYKRLDKRKIADVLLLMERDNVKPSLFTYRLLIDTKGLSNDITGMDQIVETMKSEGIELDIDTKALLARHYIFSGHKEKAEALLKEMEGGNLKEHRWACRFLLPLYAELGKIDEVKRVWKVCEKSPRHDECMAAIESWGKLSKIDEAEAVFDRMTTTWKRLSSRHYSALLKVYANHKMLYKGKDLVKRMADNGCRVGPLIWDSLIRLYVEAGEVEKADSILNKALQQKQMKPMFTSYMVIMDQYAKRGDVHNAEKIFHRMRQAGYVARVKQFQTLAQTYINAKAPAYGIRERMKADNIFPNRGLAAQMAQIDAFRKTAVSDLLD